MQFGEAGTGVAVDHCLGPLHRLVGGQMFPWIGTEMIASEDQSGRVKADARRDAFHEFAEISGRHSSITALLVNLVAGRLDENAPVHAQRERQSGLYDDGMGGANRCDTGSAVGQPFAHEWREEPSHRKGFPE
jgi:hypothetical protein